MRGYSTMTDEERQSILQQHQTLYNGYAVGNVPSNMTPLTVVDYAQDKGGITVNSRGEVSEYKNFAINEAKTETKEEETSDTNYSEEDPAFDYKSGGPEQFEPSSDDQDPYEMDLEAIQNMFDYEDIMGNGDTGEDMMALQQKMDGEFSGKEKLGGEKKAFDFDSEGGNVDVFGEEEMCEQCETYEEVDDEIKESFMEQRQKIVEMFNRFNKFN
jgi:hypothetical protein